MTVSFYIPHDPAAQLLVTGEDAFEFLQGQFTNDLQPVLRGDTVYGLWLNQKGRVLADSFVWRRPDGAFVLVSEGSSETSIRERLEAYVIADDVMIELVPDRFCGWIFAGPRAQEWIDVLEVRPAQASEPERDGVRLLRSRRGGRNCWRLHVPRESSEDWGRRIRTATESVPITPEVASASRIRDGIPAIPEDLHESDLPNEGGLEHDAISYTKGCYLGQEVMARLKNLGRVRRRLFVLRGASASTTPPPRTPLFAADRPVGETRSAAMDGDGWVALAMLHTDHVEAGGRLRLGGQSGVEAVVVGVAEGRAW